MAKIISTNNAPAAIGPYSQAVQVGQHIFLSGQLGIDPASGELAADDIRTQTAQALKNMEAVLKEAGATVQNVVKTTVFILDMADFSAVNEIYGKIFAANPPARSCIAVAALPKGAKVEIEAIAVLK